MEPAAHAVRGSACRPPGLQLPRAMQEGRRDNCSEGLFLIQMDLENFEIGCLTHVLGFWNLDECSLLFDGSESANILRSRNPPRTPLQKRK